MLNKYMIIIKQFFVQYIMIILCTNLVYTHDYAFENQACHVTVLCAVVGVVVTCIIKWYNYSNSTYIPGSQIHVINCSVNSVIVYTKY